MHRRLIAALGSTVLLTTTALAVSAGPATAAAPAATTARAKPVWPAAAPATATAPAATDPGAAIPVPSRYLMQELNWRVCDSETGTECAYMRVPRDWSHPNARVDISIAVSRTAPTNPSNPDQPVDFDRYVFGNPGGPGAPGLGMAPMLASVPGLTGHAGVGFDVRGTGSSTNVSCDGAPFFTMDPRDRRPSTLRMVSQASQLYDDYCRLGSRGLRDFVTTEQTVKDIDLLRRLLGVPTFDYVGYSGGTWLGAYYQKYFPSRAGRFVLDSNTDFTKPWNVTFEAQPQSFERRFRQDFAAWAAKYDANFGLGATPEEVRRFYERLRADLVSKPIDTGWAVIDAPFIDRAIASSMYSKYYFQSLAEDLDLLRMMADDNKRSGAAAARARLAKQPQQTRDRLARIAEEARSQGGSARPVAADAYEATFTAITCNDTPWPRGQAYLDELSGRLGKAYPLIGWSTNQQPCAYWTRPALRMPVPDGVGVANTLLVQSDHDPATNSRLAVNAHKSYRGSVLVWVAKEGDHGIYAGDNKCVDAIVNTYLNTGVAPKSDQTCQGVGIPAPVTDNGRAPVRLSVLDRVRQLNDRIRSKL